MIIETRSELLEVPVEKLHPSPENPRSDLGDLEGLIASICTAGVIEPLIVTRDEGGWTVVAGHRRLAAAIAAGATSVPCIERVFESTAERIEVMAIENLQRADLSPLDEARAFRMLADLGHSQRDIAERVGCNQSHVSKRLSLGELPAAATELLTAGRLTLHQAEELARLDEDDVDDVVAEVDRQAKSWHEKDAELPAYVVAQSVDRVARARKVAAAEDAATKSGLKRLKTKPYTGAGDHRPCKRKEATHVYVDAHSGSITWARTASAEHKANGTFDATANQAEPEWQRRRREREAVNAQRTELLDKLDNEVLDAVGIRELLAEMAGGHEVRLDPIEFDEGEDPLHVIAYAYLSATIDDATEEPVEGAWNYGEAVRVRAMWAELAETIAVEAEAAELPAVVEPEPVDDPDMFGDEPVALPPPIVEGVGGPTLVLGEPMRPEWTTKMPWATYGGHVLHRLLRRIGEITDADLLRHMLAYEGAHPRPETAEIASAVIDRYVAIS